MNPTAEDILRNLAADLAMCDLATPGPWRDLTDEWNQSQADYYRRYKRHWHGPLRGAKKVSSKSAHVLIVQDCYHGRPIDLSKFPAATPDWYDLRRIVTVSSQMWQALWKGSGPIESKVEGSSAEAVANRAFIAGAREGWPAAIRRAMAAEAELTRLRELVRTLAEQVASSIPCPKPEGDTDDQ